MFLQIRGSIRLLLATAILTSFAASSSAQQATPEGARGGWRGGCAADIPKFCGGVKGGQGKRHCLEAVLTKLSSTCQAALAQRRQQRAMARKICANDIAGVCKEAAAGSGSAKIACLRQKQAELAPDCAKAIAGLGAGSGQGKSAGAPKN